MAISTRRLIQARREFALRDAITAVNTKVAVNGCPADTDTITFSVSSTITLRSGLPAIANAATASLTIAGSGRPFPAPTLIRCWWWTRVPRSP